jgi:peptidyl-prolyl cis-trans isomerase A (cyclophilin A)
MNKILTSRAAMATLCSFSCRLIGLLLTTLLLSNANAESTATRVRIQTTMGTIVVELDAARAPLTVKNFLQYVAAGQYNGTIFHRVVAGFIVQGGGFDIKGVEKPSQGNLVNESGNGLRNRRGTIAMARTDSAHSATTQFYFNLAENVELDPQPARWGYAVFGKVIEGMEVVQAIGEVQTGIIGSLDEAPLKPVVIQKIEVME